MEYRVLGKTGLKVSSIGMGCWAIGGDAWGPVEDRDSIAAIHEAIDLGANFIDTADVYGRGHSEELVARALEGKDRTQVVIASKVGLWLGHGRPNKYTDPQQIIEHCEASLKRLKTDYIDVYQCHLWWDENTEVFLEAFETLTRQGKIRHYGVSTNEVAHVKHFNQQGTCGVVQLDYSILNRTPEQELLPYCLEANIGTIIRGPIRMGLLAGKFTRESTFPEGDVRRNWPQEDWFQRSLEKVERLKPLATAQRPLSQVALEFVLHYPAVTVAIPGAKNAAQMSANAMASGARLSDAELALINNVAPLK